MNKLMLIYSAIFLSMVFFSVRVSAISNSNEDYLITDNDKNVFTGNFYVFYSEKDPKMALRASGIKGVQYNVITWEGQAGKSDVVNVKRLAEQAGDGFDDTILDGSVAHRSADVFALSSHIFVTPERISQKNGITKFHYASYPTFDLSARISWNTTYQLPELTYTLTPKMKGFFSVLYAGSPEMAFEKIEELWQPMIWQEKRFPDKSYITAAFQTPIPSTLVSSNGYTYGVIAHPSEFPFDPLPTLANSRFAVAVRTAKGNLAPMIIAPIFGGFESHRNPNQDYTFKALLYIKKHTISTAYENIAREVYGFRDYRQNDIASLNETFENIVDYSLSKYSWFIEEEKGCAYSTDVPGAVKNVSGLNPLELAIVTDNSDMFEKRAYPIIEYMLSREKFLFCADSTQKIQSPSRKMHGPIAPISELSSLYSIAGKNMPFLVKLAESEYNKKRIRNLEVKEFGRSWQNALWLYKATNNETWLKKAIEGADEYLAKRVVNKANSFEDPQGGGFFFWTGFTPRWIDLLELYETTSEKRFLDAARDGARNYTMFAFMSPSIPNDSVVVNKGGIAPFYWYLQRKGHQQMLAPEEKAPAWRLSEIGLTPESSGTCSGHRAIFMANYAPWMLRIAHYTNDRFLADVAKAAIIGRYRNFPGYHMNTARTTIYEKSDYPLRSHKELSVNSFHYNHIMPQASFLLDYLVTDVWSRSDKAIDFPTEFIEGYAYLQSKFYGHKSGTFYNESAQLWMPARLLKITSVELNYISAQADDKLMLAFTNQSKKIITTKVTLNQSKILSDLSKEYRIRVVKDNKVVSNSKMVNGVFEVEVSPDGITAYIIESIQPKVVFQDKLLAEKVKWEKDYDVSGDDKIRAMILQLGNASTTAFIYLTEDDTKYSSAMLRINGKEWKDDVYPYEFTLPVSDSEQEINAEVFVVDRNGEILKLGQIHLSR